MMLTKKEICELFGLSPKTAQTKIHEIENQILRGRYNRYSVVRNGRILRVSQEVFLDYLSIEQSLKHGVEVPPYDYQEAHQALGRR